MGKRIFVIAISCLGILFTLYFFTFLSSEPTHLAIPTTSLEESICKKITEQFGDCQRILMFDARSNLVFVESSSGIIPVLTNQEFTDFKKFISPIMDFQEFNEEKVERGPIDWRADNHVQEDFSIIYGFAEDGAKTIVINSEGNIQPNRFLVRDNLWVWYATFKNDVQLPVDVTVYDGDGQIIYGEKAGE